MGHRFSVETAEHRELINVIDEVADVRTEGDVSIVPNDIGIRSLKGAIRRLNACANQTFSIVREISRVAGVEG